MLEPPGDSSSGSADDCAASARRAASKVGEPAAPSRRNQPLPAVDAATVVLVRDAPQRLDGMEVLLLRRARALKAFAGALVFPGGKVEVSDRHLDPSCWMVTDLAARSREIGAESDEAALGFLVAAVRETFEEAGILLARSRDGSALRAADLRDGTFADVRRRLSSRSSPLSWAQWLTDQQFVVDLDALVMWSWWVTPVHRPYRFDTRFFIAASPEGRTAAHDRAETTATFWFSPSEVIERFAHDQVHLRNPTVRNLAALTQFGSVEAAMSAARRGEIDRRRVQATVSWDGDELRMRYAPDEAPQMEMPLRRNGG